MRAILMGIGFCFCCGAATGTHESPAASWGKLFFSARARQQRIEPVFRQGAIDYQGILLSPGKPPTYWINGVMQSALPPATVRRGNHLIVQYGDKTVALVPGQRHGVATADKEQAAQ